MSTDDKDWKLALKAGFQIIIACVLTFYCSVVGHRAAGMEGTITVESSGGSGIPGFELFLVMFGLTAAVGIIKLTCRNVR